MCGGSSNNATTTTRTVITDEFKFEHNDEASSRVKFCAPAAPPKPLCTCLPSEPLPKYEPPRYIPLKRCPSLTSVVTVQYPCEPCPPQCPPPPALKRCGSQKSCCKPKPAPPQDECNTVITLVNLPLNPPRQCRARSRSRSRLCITEDGDVVPMPDKLVRSTSITYKSNENLNVNDTLNIKYDFQAACDEAPAPKPKCTCPPKPQPQPSACGGQNACPLPVYPSICAKPAPAPASACSCSCKKPAAPPACTCPAPPKPKLECTCPPPPKPKCTCPPKNPCGQNACPLPVYPSICAKSSSNLASTSSSCLSKSFSNLANVETVTTTTTTTAPPPCQVESSFNETFSFYHKRW